MIEKMAFGKTGHNSSRVLFGGAALWGPTPAQTAATLELLLEYGINHIDTAASYGEAELHIGPWMAQYRDNFFLATKTDRRTYADAYAEIQRSLERLRVDQVDLIQLHNLVDPDEWETAFSPGGALEAALTARDKGYVRFIGVTGHGLSVPERHLHSLQRFPFDSVLLPYNYNFMQLPDYRAGFERLLAYCQENQVAVQTIKTIARGRWGDQARNHTTWYQPLESQAEIDTAVHYALSQPGIYLNSVGDLDLLPKVLEAARRYAESEPLPALEGTLAGAALTPLFTDGDDI